MAGLLLPNPLAPLAGLACCTAAAGTAYAMRRKIPHPSELDIIGRALVWTKCHSHQKFDLLVSVQVVENVPKGSKVYVYAESGRFDARTQNCRTDDKTQKAEFHERLSLHCRTVDDTVTITVYKKLTLSSEDIGTVELNVVHDLIEEDFPTNKWYTAKKDGKNTARVQLSFYKLEGGAGDMSPLLQQAIIQTQFEATAKGEAAPTYDFQNMEPKERLQLLAKALEGPLKTMRGSGIQSWSPHYFKLLENQKGEWEWCYWKDKKDMQKGAKPLNRIYMLAISNVLPDPGNRHQFYMKYHDSHGVHDLMFLRVDRDRDVWSDGIYEFLDRYRDYIDKYGTGGSKVNAYLEEKTKKKKHSDGVRRRPSFTVSPSARRVALPSKNDEDLAKAPKGLADMAKEMYETDSDDDGDDDTADRVAPRKVSLGKRGSTNGAKMLTADTGSSLST